MKTIKEMIDEKEISRLNRYVKIKKRLLNLSCFSTEEKKKIRRDIQYYNNYIANLKKNRR